MAKRAIGIFDSGVGGLTVLKEVATLLPGEDIIYLGDTARVPYGTKSPSTVKGYAKEAGAFLAGKGVKLIVVACNTASAVSLTLLEEAYNIPVVGVIEPGAKGAITQSLGQRIGVIGTEGTIKSGAYEKSIKKLAPDAAVFTKACPLFVPLVEEGWLDHEVARLVAKEYLAPLLKEEIDTLVLGCTHYPLLKTLLKDLLPKGVSLVDSACETAKSVAQQLQKHSLNNRAPQRTVHYYVTDASDRFSRIGGAFLQTSQLIVNQVQL